MKEIVKKLLFQDEHSLKQVCRATGLEKKKAKKILREVKAVKTKREGTVFYSLKIAEKKGIKIRVNPKFFEIDSFIKL